MCANAKWNEQVQEQPDSGEGNFKLHGRQQKQ